MAVSPLAFMHIVSAPLQANNEFYPLPDGFWYELLVEIKESVSATTYTAIERGSYDRDRSLVVAASAVPTYDLRGRHIVFSPIPSFSVNPGFRLQFVPTLDMATDTVASELHTGLHMAIVLASKLFLMGETLESAEPSAAQLKAYLEKIPLYYQRGGEAQTLRIDAGQPLAPSRFPWWRGTGLDYRRG